MRSVWWFTRLRHSDLSTGESLAQRARALAFSTLVAVAAGNYTPAHAQDPALDAAPDPVLKYLQRPRYYLIIGVDKMPNAPAADLPYAQVDVQNVKEALESAGFKPLSESPPLTGDDASRPKVDSLLRDIRTLPDKSTVLVYYSGHAWTDKTHKDVWLQLSDNTVLGDQGLSVANLLTFPRDDWDAGGGWRGELAVIVDSCYSGKAAFGSPLYGDTALLASSDGNETSRPIALDSGKVSAFTYALLQAAGPKFTEANSARDGILTFNDLVTFTTSQLMDWKDNGKIDGPMNPRLLGNAALMVFKYDAAKSTVVDSPLRRIISHRLIEELIQPDIAMPEASLGSEPSLAALRDTVAGVIGYFPEGPEKDGLREFAKGQVNVGLQLLKSVDDSDGASNAVQYGLKPLLAKLYTAAGQHAQASSTYAALLDQTAVPSNELKLAAANSMLRARSLKSAQSLLRDVVASSPAQTRLGVFALSSLGYLYTATGEYRKAQGAYKTALGSIPENARETPLSAAISSNLANAYMLDRRFDAAEKQYATTIELQRKLGTDAPQQISDLEKYSTVLGTKKKLDEAYEAKKQADVLKAQSGIYTGATETIQL